MLIVAVAHAQVVPEIEVDAELFHTAVDARRTLWTDDAGRPELAAPFVNVLSWYAHRPLSYGFSDGTEVAVVSGALRTDVAGGFAWQGLRGAVLVPLSWSAASEVRNGGGTGLGDLVLDVKGTALDPADAAVGVAFVGRLQLPTATLDLPLGSPGAVGEVSAVVSKDLGPVALAGNLGQRLGPRSDLGGAVVNDALVWRLGGSVPLGPEGISAALEAAGRLGYGSPFAAGSPVEVLLSGMGPLPSGFAWRGGLAGGLDRAVGVPAFRVVLGVTWTGAAPTVGGRGVVDRDGDAIDGDRCPAAPEDRDGYEDEDGCPDADDDADGVVDGLDACRTEPEDRDGFKDEDGCPDPKTRVGVRVVSPDGEVWQPVSVDVVCGTFARAISADQAIDVEPGECTFGGGGTEAVPAFTRTVAVGPGAQEVEVPLALAAPTGVVAVTVTDTAGAPVDQAAWTFDGQRPMRVSGAAKARVPPGPHTVKVFAQGYGDYSVPVEVSASAPVALTVALEPLPAWSTKNRVMLAHPLTFAPETSLLEAASEPTIAGVAAWLVAHPELFRVRVEAHVGPAGDAAENQLLSDARALAVRDALVAAGVSADRVVALGMGESRPIPSGSERVDLWIEARAE